MPPIAVEGRWSDQQGNGLTNNLTCFDKLGFTYGCYSAVALPERPWDHSEDGDVEKKVQRDETQTLLDLVNVLLTVISIYTKPAFQTSARTFSPTLFDDAAG